MIGDDWHGCAFFSIPLKYILISVLFHRNSHQIYDDDIPFKQPRFCLLCKYCFYSGANKTEQNQQRTEITLSTTVKNGRKEKMETRKNSRRKLKAIKVIPLWQLLLAIRMDFDAFLSPHYFEVFSTQIGANSFLINM